MIDPNDINSRIESLQELMHAKLGTRGQTLAAHFKRAGRRLPKTIQKHGSVLSDAQEKARNPNLIKMLDEAAINRAFDRVTEHVSGIDPADRRKGAILGALGGLVFNLLILMVLLVVLLKWRGLI